MSGCGEEHRKGSVQLTPRLQAAAQYVPEGAYVADIGTDHAHLPIYLMVQGIARGAVGVDNKPGPLERARANVCRCGLADKIDLRLGFGLSCVSPAEADTVVIAGMGGESMVEILEDAREQGKEFQTYTLQPMSMEEKLRGYLLANGYTIADERLVQEGDKLYTVLCVCGGKGAGNYSEEDAYIGRRLRENRDPLLPLWVRRQLVSCRRALSALEASAEAADRKEKFLKKVALLEQVERECQSW